MYKPDGNTSFMSMGEVPVGFRSFAMDAYDQNDDDQQENNIRPCDISFAKELEKYDPPSPKPAEMMVLGEI